MSRAFVVLIWWVLGALLLALPWLFGGALSGTQSSVCWTVAGLLAVGLLLAWAAPVASCELRVARLEAVVGGASSDVGLSRALCAPGWRVCCLLMVGVLLGCYQLLPLPVAAVRWLAPGATAWRQQQLGDVAASVTAASQEDGSDDGVRSATPPAQADSSLGLSSRPARTRSLYPPDTRKGLALLLLGAAVLWLSLVLARPTFVRWTLIAVTTNGILIALSVIVRQIRGVEKQALIDQFSSTGISLGPFGGLGPFVNRNNEGGYLCLCLSAAIGLLAIASLDSRDEPQTVRADDRRSASRTASMVAIVFLCAGILATGSRGASLALASGLIVTLIIAWRTIPIDVAGVDADSHRTAGGRDGGGRRSSQFKIAAAGVTVVALTAALLGWLGAAEETSERWQQTLDERVTDLRVTNWREALGSSGEFAGLGSGLMTYRFVSLPLQNRRDENWYRYAENQFVQAYVDAGAVGLLILLGCLGLFARALWKLLHRSTQPNPWATAMGLMGIFLMTSQVVSSLFDFGWYVPANLCLMAVLVGFVLIDYGTAYGAAHGRMEQPVNSPPTGTPISQLVVGCLLLMPLAVGGFDLRNADRIERLTSNQLLSTLAENKSADQIDDWIAALTGAVSQRWDDGEAHHQLSQLYLQRYRIGMFDELRRRQPWLPEQRHWRESSFAFQLRALRDKDASERARYRQLAAESAYLSRAAKHCELARVHCPWLPEPHLWSALTQYLQGSISNDAVNETVERATRFGQGRASTWFWAGVLQSLAGDKSQASAAWQQCIGLSSEFEAAIVPWRGNKAGSESDT